MATRHLKLSDIIQAFEELGGEADWPDVEARVMAKRGNGFAPYKDWRNYKNTMFQLVQQNCEGYSKFTGAIVFEKVREGSFRLYGLPLGVVSRKSVLPEEVHPETVPENGKYMAGAVRQVLVNAYERDPDARKACFDQYGKACTVCGIRFEKRYGPIGKGFIHVHHKKPLATREVYRLDPVKDLVPVCPNCHSMLHTSDPPLTVDELKALMVKARSNI